MDSKRIAKNIGISGLAQIISSVIGFIMLIYCARYLGEVEFGKYNFGLSFTALFMIFSDIGINQFIIREIARNEKLTNEYITNVVVIKLLLSFFTFGLIVLTINLMNYPQQMRQIVYIFGLYVILSSFSLTFKSIFQAYEKMEYCSFVIIAEQIILFSLVLSVIYLGFGLFELAYSYVIVGFLSIFLSSIIFVTKIAKPKFEINFLLWNRLIVGSIPFALNAFFAVLFFRIDSVMLSYFKGDSAVGIYTAAYNPLLALSGIITQMVISTLYPIMAKSFIISTDSLKSITILASKYMVIIAFPISIGCCVLADKFIALFYAGAYYDSIFAFKILALFIPIRLISTITGTLLSSINKQNLRMISVGFSSLLNIALNFALIPILSYVGASIATVLSELVLYFFFMYFTKEHYLNLQISKYYSKPFIASFIMGISIYSIKLDLIPTIFFSIVIYFLTLCVLGTFTQEDKNIFNSLFTQKR